MFNSYIKEEFLVYLQKLKKENDLKIVDTHVHPFDVMGVAHFHDYKEKDNEGLYYNNFQENKNDYFKPGLGEMMKFNETANFLSKNAFKFLPKFVNKEIKNLYNLVGIKRVIEEMEKSLVDEVVFLPVEPWANTDWSGKYYNNKRFFLLGSIDIHKIKKEEIKGVIKRYISDFKIIGIKLHPNLQNFKPRPSDNPKEIAEKLEIIYFTAEENNLYLLFHGGVSYFTNKPDKKYPEFARSGDNALLENFCDKDGRSEIFDLKIPIIIAHLGHFGVNKINYSLVEKITKRYSNLYFDTAAISPRLIQKFIELIGSNRILLGSDAFYNRMIFASYFVFLGAKQSNTEESLDDIMINILGKNFYSRILRKI